MAFTSKLSRKFRVVRRCTYTTRRLSQMLPTYHVVCSLCLYGNPEKNIAINSIDLNIVYFIRISITIVVKKKNMVRFVGIVSFKNDETRYRRRMESGYLNDKIILAFIIGRIHRMFSLWLQRVVYPQKNHIYDT